MSFEDPVHELQKLLPFFRLGAFIESVDQKYETTTTSSLFEQLVERQLPMLFQLQISIVG